MISLQMLCCTVYFLRKKFNIAEIKKLVNKYCQFLQFMPKIIMCKKNPNLCQFLDSLTLTFKMIIQAYCHVILTMLYHAGYF